MGMLGKLLGATIDVVTAPLDIAADAFTMGNLEGKEPYTVKKAKKILNKLGDAADDAADGDLL